MRWDAINVNNGQELLDFYIQNHRHFDAVLTDIDMPLLDGIDATIQIREYEREHNLPEKKIVVFTGNNTEK